MAWLKRVIVSWDRFTVGLLISVVTAILVPCRGDFAHWVEKAGDVAVMLLFFLYGAKLSRRSVYEGLMNWRLQGVVALSTFVMIPIIGLVFLPLFNMTMPPDLTMGMLYVCMLPSTVQSSIAFTSIAGGNVAAAVCAASVSSLLGVFLTPLLVGLFVMPSKGEGIRLEWSTFVDICWVILVPFIVGQIARIWIGPWIKKHQQVTSWTDQSTIWLIVYSAFSHAILSGVWKEVPLISLVAVVVCCAVILCLTLFLTAWMSKRLGFPREDRIVVVFCGTKKSMATGIPMMNVLFSGLGPAMGVLALPLMIFHQMQLMICAVLAKHWGKAQQKS